MEMSLVATLFPGIASLFVQDPVIACARIYDNFRFYSGLSGL